MKTALTVVLVAAAACGGTAKPDSTVKPDMGARSAEGGDHRIAPPIEKFHDTLAPRWHAPQGAQRMADTCAAMPQFHADASAIATSQAPGGDAASWSMHTRQLSDAVGALDATCKANDAAAFEPAFERVHSSFHSVMEAGGHHKEHGKGEHGKHGMGEHGKHGMGEHGKHGMGEHGKHHGEQGKEHGEQGKEHSEHKH